MDQTSNTSTFCSTLPTILPKFCFRSQFSELSAGRWESIYLKMSRNIQTVSPPTPRCVWHTFQKDDLWELCCSRLWWEFFSNEYQPFFFGMANSKGGSLGRKVVGLWTIFGAVAPPVPYRSHPTPAQWISNWNLTFPMNCWWQLAGITNCSSAIQCSHFSDDYCQIFVQLLMTARWLIDWLMTAKFWRLLSNLQLIIVYWWLKNSDNLLNAVKLLIEDTKSMLRLCWRLLSNLRSMIDNCKSWSQSWLNWTNKLSTFEEKAKPDYFSEKLNWTCRILQAVLGKVDKT